MTRIGKIRRVNFKKIRYGKGLDGFLTRATKDPKPEYNIITQKEVPNKVNIKEGEVNYVSNRITMDPRLPRARQPIAQNIYWGGCSPHQWPN